MSETLALSKTVANVRKSAFAAAAAALLPLTGRYEVVIPGCNEVIFFTDSLRAAARHVAIARWGKGNEAKTDEILGILEEVEKMGALDPGEYGFRVSRPYSSDSPWMAKVRGTQVRPLPQYAIGDYVEATDEHGPLPSYLKPGRQLRIYSVRALNDRRAGKQYAYQVGSTESQHLSENRLRPITAVKGELNFDGLSA